MKEFTQSSELPNKKETEINAALRAVDLVPNRMNLWRLIIQESGLANDVKKGLTSQLYYFQDMMPSDKVSARVGRFMTMREKLENLAETISIGCRYRYANENNKEEIQAVLNNIVDDIKSLTAELYS
jgi:hypothetical protein